MTETSEGVDTAVISSSSATTAESASATLGQEGLSIDRKEDGGAGGASSPENPDADNNNDDDGDDSGDDEKDKSNNMDAATDATADSADLGGDKGKQQQQESGDGPVAIVSNSKKSRPPYKFDPEKITLRFLFANRDGLTVTVECRPADTVGEVKGALLSVWPSDLPDCSGGDRVRLVCMGKGYLMPDTRTLEECQIPVFKTHATPINVSVKPEADNPDAVAKKKGSDGSGGGGPGGGGGGAAGGRGGGGGSSSSSPPDSSAATGQGCTCAIL